MKKSLVLISIVILAFSCRKDESENPYDDIVYTINDNPDFGEVDPSNFAYLHEKVFRPTCANSGCHDGTFEPEFRSITSSYNSLVNHPVISNDAQNSFTKRVFPGSFNQSLLNARLTTELPNSSGIMPLEVDSESDWETNSSNYISQIQAWIAAGAPDMFGNLPGSGNADLPPSINGFVVLPNNNTTDPYERDPDAIGLTPILVDAALVDIWILAEDDTVDSQDLPLAQISYATTIEDIMDSSALNYSTESVLNALDFSNNETTFYHKATLDLSAYESGTNLYIRSYLNDGNQDENIEIPNSGSNNVITSIFVLQIL